MNTTANNIKASAAITFIGGLLVLLITLFLLVKLATTGYYSNVSDMQPSAVETRIQPTGRLTMGDGTPVGEREGKQVFDKVCIQCHGADKTLPSPPKLPTTTNGAPASPKASTHSLPTPSTALTAQAKCPHAVATAPSPMMR